MVYLDNAASTPPLPPVLRALVEATEAHFANAASAHRLGAAAARALEAARAQVAALLGASAAEVTFTSGGTEANALGILGAARARKPAHVVAVSSDHASVLRNVQRLAEEGFGVSLVRPDPDGTVCAEKVLREVTAETCLVAMTLVNGELGTIAPVERVAQALQQTPRPPHLHVDAVQAAAWLPLSAPSLGATSVAISGHKLHGPKGTGALWLRKGARLHPLWEGGGQETARRSGTEPVPALVAFGEACAQCLADRRESAHRVTALRDEFERRVTAAVPQSRPTVARQAPRAPHISSVRLPALPAEPLLHALEARQVYASAGSACASRKASHVLAALGIPERDAVLRFSFSRLTTSEDLDRAVAALAAAVDEVASVANLLTARKRR